MKKSILILGVVALLGSKSFGMGASMSAQPMATMERMVMLDVLTENQSNESLVEKDIITMQRFRETIIQSFIAGKNKEEIVLALLEMDESHFLHLVGKTNKMIEISINVLKEVDTLPPHLLTQFQKENLILDTWVSLLVNVSLDRK